MKYIEDHIKANWKRKTVPLMAAELNLPEALVRKHVKKLGIDPIGPKDLKVAFILDNYQHMTPGQMAAELDCTKVTVCDIMEEYELTAFKKTDVPIVEEAPAEESPLTEELSDYIATVYVKPGKPKRPPAVYNQSGSPYQIAAKNTLP